jgi:hypothetical protein
VWCRDDDDVEDLCLEEIQRLVQLQERRLAKELGKGMYLLFLPSLVPSVIEKAHYFRQDKCNPSSACNPTTVWISYL